MATNWPTSRDTFTNPSSGDTLDSPSHAAQHANINDAVSALQQYAGLVLVKSQAIGTAVSSVTMTNAFSSTFDNYRILMSFDTGSQTGLSSLLRFGSTATNYYSVKTGIRWDGTSITTAVDNGTSLDLGAFSSEGGGLLTVDVSNPFLTKPTLVAGVNSYARFTTSPKGGALHCAGGLNDSSSYSAFTVLLISGTMTGGTIRVYGYNNG